MTLQISKGKKEASNSVCRWCGALFLPAASSQQQQRRTTASRSGSCPLEESCKTSR